MDLLYSRYASPLSYIDGLIEIGMFAEGIVEMVKQDDEDRMWQLYLHSNKLVSPEKSFNDWKESVMTASQQRKPMSKSELKAAKNKADNILSNFKIQEI